MALIGQKRIAVHEEKTIPAPLKTTPMIYKN